MADETPAWGEDSGEGRPHFGGGETSYVPGTNKAGQEPVGGAPPQAPGQPPHSGLPGGPPGGPHNWFPPNPGMPGPPHPIGQPGGPGYPGQPGHPNPGAGPVQGQPGIVPGTNMGGQQGMASGAIPAQSAPGVVPGTNTAGYGSFGGSPPQGGPPQAQVGGGIVPGTNTAGSTGQMSPGGPSRTPGGNPPGQPGVGGGPYTGYGSGAPPSGPISNDPLHPNPGEIAGLGPANVQEFGGSPQVNPTYANAASIDPANAQSYLNQYERATMGALNPLFQQENAQLAQANAARGITNSGSAAQLQSNLMGQQAGQYASAISPLISQGFGYAQQDVTGNAGYRQQANLQNAQTSNEANVLNANYYNQDRYANYGAYNNFQNEMLSMGGGMLSADQTAYLNSFGPSTGVESAYNGALSGQLGAYSNTYGSLLQQQAAETQAAGAAFGGGK